MPLTFVGTSFGSRYTRWLKTVSSATGSFDTSMTSICVGVPDPGPLPSMAVTPSMMCSTGLTRSLRSAIILAKVSAVANLAWDAPLLKPYTQPKVFFTAPVIRSS